LLVEGFDHPGCSSDSRRHHLDPGKVPVRGRGQFQTPAPYEPGGVNSIHNTHTFSKWEYTKLNVTGVDLTHNKHYIQD